MATAYHLEALRRQKIIDRNLKAKQQVDHEIPEVIAVEGGRQSSTCSQNSQQESTRPKSAASVTSNVSSVGENSRGSRMSSKQSSRPMSACSSKSSTKSVNSQPTRSSSNSKHSSRPTSAPLSASHSRVGSKKSMASFRAERSLSKNSDKEKECSNLSQIGSIPVQEHPTSESQGSVLSNSRAPSTSPIDSRPRSNSSGKRSKSGSTSTSQRSVSSKARIKAEQVRQDLQKQELVLRDSNLVMGEVPLEEEVDLKRLEGQFTPH